MEISERRVKVADLISQGVKPDEIAKQLGYKDAKSVYQATASPAVAEQIKWHRDNLFEQSRIDRVQLLRNLYESITCPTGPIFATLQGPDSDNHYLLASNLSKLNPVQSSLIQQIEMSSTSLPTGETDDDGDPIHKVVAIISKIRFHSPDAARKILSKAAGFEDGLPAKGEGEGGGPFRGMTIVPPKEVIEMERVGEGSPENPIHPPVEGSDL